MLYHFLKKLIKTGALGLLVLFGDPAQGQGRIVITVDQFSTSKGLCKVCLFKDAMSFSGKTQPFRCQDVPILETRVAMEFSGLPEGIYAIALFHDANHNGRLDKNFLGIPTEGYGASLNRLPFAAAPRFDDNKFYVSSGKEVHLQIRLRYIL